MAENSKIGWTDHTFNPWIGCTKVGPGCDHCYAEALADRRHHWARWGAGEPRKLTSRGNWRKPLSWNRQAGRFRLKVFCASLADVFDNEVPKQWRAALWDLIRETPNIDWQLLTKRIGNVHRMLPNDWGNGYPNVWLGATVVTQAEAERDVVKLLEVPARVHWLSCEPLLEGLALRRLRVGDRLILDALTGAYSGESAPAPFPEQLAHARHGTLDFPVLPPRLPPLDWAIVGGESGLNARPMDANWCCAIAADCAVTGTAFFMKQGSAANWPDWKPHQFYRWPRELRVRQFPIVR